MTNCWEKRSSNNAYREIEAGQKIKRASNKRIRKAVLDHTLDGKRELITDAQETDKVKKEQGEATFEDRIYRQTTLTEPMAPPAHPATATATVLVFPS